MAGTSAPTFAQTQVVTVSNTATETSLLTGTKVGSATFAANTLKAGNVIFVRAWGTLSTKAAPVGVLTIRLKLPVGTVAISLPAGPNGGLMGAVWVLNGMMTIYTDGTGGTYNASGEWRLFQAGGLGVAADAGNLSIDTTAANAIDLTAQFQTANNANSITISQCSIELLSGLT